MNTLIKPDSNIGNCISFSEFYDLDLLNIKEKDDNKDCIIQSENGEDDIIDSLSSSEKDGENDENAISDSNNNIQEIKNLFKHISNENDLCYIVQQLINSINFEEIKKCINKYIIFNFEMVLFIKKLIIYYKSFILIILIFYFYLFLFRFLLLNK